MDTHDLPNDGIAGVVASEVGGHQALGVRLLRDLPQRFRIGVRPSSNIGFLPELSVYRELEEGSLAAIDVPALSHVSLKTDLIHHNDIHIDDFDEMVAIIRKAASQRPGVSPLSYI